jgi:hypothetical protein
LGSCRSAIELRPRKVSCLWHRPGTDHLAGPNYLEWTERRKSGGLSLITRLGRCGFSRQRTNGWMGTKKEPPDLSNQYQRLIKHLSPI